VNRQQSIFIYILAFVIISILLKAFGIINFENTEILGYALIFYGISLVFISFGTTMRGSLFLGTTVFLTGVLIFLFNNFTFVDTSLIILPSIFFISGISFLMLYIDDSSHNVLLYVSGIFLLTGIIVTFIFGSPEFVSFFRAVPVIFVKQLPLIIIIILLLVLLRRRDNK
jgi:hypothetical protein